MPQFSRGLHILVQVRLPAGPPWIQARHCRGGKADTNASADPATGTSPVPAGTCVENNFNSVVFSSERYSTATGYDGPRMVQRDPSLLTRIKLNQLRHGQAFTCGRHFQWRRKAVMPRRRLDFTPFRWQISCLLMRHRCAHKALRPDTARSFGEALRPAILPLPLPRAGSGTS